MQKYNAPVTAKKERDQLDPLERRRPRRDLRKPIMWMAVGIIGCSILVNIIIAVLF